MGDPQVIAVRRAAQVDSDALAGLWVEVMGERAEMDQRVRLASDARVQWEALLAEWMADETAIVLLAEKGQKLIGYAIAMILQRPLYYYQQRIGFVHDIGVDGHAHQGGVGTALLEALKMWLQQQNIDLIEVPVMRLHPMAQAFWRANGAVEVSDTFWYRLSS